MRACAKAAKRVLARRERQLSGSQSKTVSDGSWPSRDLPGVGRPLRTLDPLRTLTSVGLRESRLPPQHIVRCTNLSVSQFDNLRMDQRLRLPADFE